MEREIVLNWNDFSALLKHYSCLDEQPKTVSGMMYSSIEKGFSVTPTVRFSNSGSWGIEYFKDDPLEFKRLSSIVNSIYFEGRRFLPIRELERRYGKYVSTNNSESFQGWLFSLMRENKPLEAPYLIVNQLMNWGFWVFDECWFDEGYIKESS